MSEENRYQVLSRIINSIKEDKPVTITPCGLKLVRCTQGGIEPIKGFEVSLRDKLMITGMLNGIHQDIHAKWKETQAEKMQGAGPKGGMAQIIEATGHDKNLIANS